MQVVLTFVASHIKKLFSSKGLSFCCVQSKMWKLSTIIIFLKLRCNYKILSKMVVNYFIMHPSYVISVFTIRPKNRLHQICSRRDKPATPNKWCMVDRLIFPTIVFELSKLSTGSLISAVPPGYHSSQLRCV